MATAPCKVQRKTPGQGQWMFKKKEILRIGEEVALFWELAMNDDRPVQKDEAGAHAEQGNMNLFKQIPSELQMQMSALNKCTIPASD